MMGPSPTLGGKEEEEEEEEEEECNFTVILRP